MVEKFDQKDTKAVKGVAILLMLLHHLAGFSDRFPVGFDGFKSVLWKGFITGNVLSSAAVASKICVPIFMFLGGYGMYKKMQKGKYSFYENILGLYKKYWSVFIIFIPMAYILFRREPADGIHWLCTHYVITSRKDFVRELIANFIGFNSSMNGEWWFFSSYLVALFWGVIFCRVKFKRRDFFRECLIVFLIDIMIRNILPGIGDLEIFRHVHNNIYYNRLLELSTYSCSFFLGIVFAKYDALVRLKKRISDIPLKIPASILGLLIIFISRIYICGENAELLYVPFITVFSSVIFDSIMPLKKTFVFLGEQSTYMWLIHSFYCYYFYEFTLIVYKTQNVFIDLLILVLLSASSSVVLEYITKSAGKFFGNLKNKKNAVPAEKKEVSEEPEGSEQTVPV